MNVLAWLLVFLLSGAPAFAANVSFVATTINSSNAANTLTVDSPTGTTTGDLVIVVGTRNTSAGSGDSIVDDNGATPFTKVREDYESSNGSQLVIFRRVIQGGDPTTWTFDFSGDTSATRFSLMSATFRDQHADLFDVLPSGSTVTTENPDGGNISCNGNTTTIDNSIHVLIGGREGGSVYDGVPSGYTTIVGGGSFHQPQTSAYKIYATAGATGAQVFTGPSTGSGICQSFTIKNNTGGSSTGASFGLLGVGR